MHRNKTGRGSRTRDRITPSQSSGVESFPIRLSLFFNRSLVASGPFEFAINQPSMFAFSVFSLSGFRIQTRKRVGRVGQGWPKMQLDNDGR